MAKLQVDIIVSHNVLPLLAVQTWPNFIVKKSVQVIELIFLFAKNRSEDL